MLGGESVETDSEVGGGICGGGGGRGQDRRGGGAVDDVVRSHILLQAVAV